MTSIPDFSGLVAGTAALSSGFSGSGLGADLVYSRRRLRTATAGRHALRRHLARVVDIADFCGPSGTAVVGVVGVMGVPRVRAARTMCLVVIIRIATA